MGARVVSRGEDRPWWALAIRPNTAARSIGRCGRSSARRTSDGTRLAAASTSDAGESPKLVAVDGEKLGPKEEELPDPALKEKKGDAEDKEDDSKGREGDIYADAVLACSIENPEACVMCSG